MRTLALALAIALVPALGGCVGRPPSHDRSGEVSYNRRDLPPDEPGLFTGPDGVWTVYRNDGAAEPEPEPPAPKRTILMGGEADPPAAER